jgi:glutaredoxin
MKSQQKGGLSTKEQADPSKALEKIKKYNDVYIIFYTNGCPYCENAIALLKKSNVSWKGYNINNIKEGLTGLLNYFNSIKMLDNYNKENNTDHTTKPLIFYNQQFIGGFTDLQKIFNSTPNQK